MIKSENATNPPLKPSPKKPEFLHRLSSVGFLIPKQQKPLFPFPDRLFDVFSTIGEKANS
jgi:hypothetical protein